MAAVALIRFTQGLTVGAPGVALAGVAGVPVNVQNDSPTDIQSWKIDLVYVPPGSAVVMGTLATGNSNTPFASFTPDAVPGSYRLLLTVYTGAGQSGSSNKDIRVFGVPDSNGFIYPPYQQLPPKLPVLGSGDTGEKPDELNFGNQAYGWDGEGSEGLLLDFMRQVSAALSTISGSADPSYPSTALRDGDQKTIPVDQSMQHVGDLLIDDGDLEPEGDLSGVDFPDNHSIFYIPTRQRRLVRENEVMFYDDLIIDGHLDIDGDTSPFPLPSGQEVLDALTLVAPDAPYILGGLSPTAFLTATQARTVMDVQSTAEVTAAIAAAVGAIPASPNFNIFWDVSSDDLGAFTGSDATNTVSFTALLNRLNKWDGGSAGIVATLPAADTLNHNRRVALYEASASDSNFLTIDVQGASVIRGPGLGVGAVSVQVQGQKCLVIFQYDASTDSWEAIEGQTHIVVAASSGGRVLTTLDGTLSSVSVASHAFVGNDGSGIDGFVVSEGSIVGRPDGGSLSSQEPRVFQDRIFSDLITNGQGSSITQGQAVRYSTAADNTVLLAQANSAANAKAWIGAVRDTSIANGVAGLIQTNGLITIPTALQEGGAWARGDEIFLSPTTAGRYTKVAPTTSGHVILRVGWSSASPAGGDAFVLIDKGTAVEIA